MAEINGHADERCRHYIPAKNRRLRGHVVIIAPAITHTGSGNPRAANGG